MQVMNDLGQQIKGIRKKERERNFLGSPNSSLRVAGGNLKGVRVLGERVLGIPTGRLWGLRPNFHSRTG